MEVLIDPEQQSSRTIELLIHHLPQRKAFKLIKLSQAFVRQSLLKVELPMMVTQTGTVNTVYDICEELCRLTHCQSLFMGCTQQVKDAIRDIGDKIANQPNLDQWLNSYLEDKTFLVANHLTLADLVAFTSMIDIVCLMQDTRKLELCNLFRWFDHIQHLHPVKQFLQDYRIKLADKPDLTQDNKKKKK